MSQTRNNPTQLGKVTTLPSIVDKTPQIFNNSTLESKYKSELTLQLNNDQSLDNFNSKRRVTLIEQQSHINSRMNPTLKDIILKTGSSQQDS